MNTLPTSAIQAAQRLVRLESYLQADPNNNALRVDAFETALAANNWPHAQIHLQQGLAALGDELGWALREGDFWLAQQRYDDAWRVLQALLHRPPPSAEFSDVLLHNLGFVQYIQGQYEACVALLAQRLEGNAAPGRTTPTAAWGSLQMLWLRALHQTQQLSRAHTWALAEEQQSRLTPQTAGVAALVALDADDLPSAQRWAAIALTPEYAPIAQLEAWVAQASLALGANDPPQAQACAGRALQLRPNDGRAWSAQAFADLLNQNMDKAQASFERAVTAMPGHIGTWLGLAWTQLMRRDLPDAQKQFEHALALDRNFGESHGGLAVALALQGQVDMAREHMERALRLDPGSLSGQYAQALLNGEAQDVASFQRLVQRLLAKQGVVPVKR